MTAILGAVGAIFRDNLFPLFVLLGLGYMLQKRLGLDMKTLSRVNIYVFVPALAIHALSAAELSPEDLLRMVGCTLALMAVQYAAVRGWTKLRGYSTSLSTAFLCSVLFYNSGNYGYALIELLYGRGSAAAGLQAIVLAVQNTTMFCLGILLIRGPQAGVKKALGEYFRMPFPYAVGLGLLLQQTPLELPGFLAKPIDIAAAGLVPVALVTLGAQLALVSWKQHARPSAAACVMRLLVAPALMFGLLRLLGWTGVLAQVLLISSSVPTAVNTVLLAIEFDNEPDFASQVVLLTTAFSAATVALVIFVAQRALA